MTKHEYLLKNLDPSAAAALLAKFREAERRHGRSLPDAYLARMVRNYLADVRRAQLIGERAAARRLVEKAYQLERERRVRAFVEAAEQLDELLGMAWVDRLTTVQQAQLRVLQLAVFEWVPQAELARRFDKTPSAIYKWVERARTRLRPKAVALGFASLVEVALDSTISRDGGAVGFRDDH